MANYRITVSIDNKAEFDRVFQRIDANLSDLTEVWEVVKNEFWAITKDQFKTGGAAGASGKWKPLSKKYEARKIEKYGNKPILQATDAMQKAYTSKTGDSVVEIKKDSITIGAKGKVGQRAMFHQRGGGRLPQRKIIDFSDKQKTNLQKKIQKKMLDLMKKQKIDVE